MKIIIETIPHDNQRYETVGDWFYDDYGTLNIKVSELGDWKYEALIAVHELWEVLLCKHRGVNQDDVDKFDRAYEENREEGDESEPGDDNKAPYRREHCSASGAERLLAAEFDILWNDYADAVTKLSQQPDL